MKIKLALIALIALTVSLQSCGGGGESTENEEQTTDLPPVLANGTVQLDLSDYYMEFKLYVPDSSRGIPEIEDTGFGQTAVRVGSTYNLLVGEGGDLQAKKAEVADDLMFKNTIVEEGEDFILYKSEVEGSFLDPEFHFYAVKNINGIQYEFMDNKDEGPYAESVARLMLESVNHHVVNKTAS